MSRQPFISVAILPKPGETSAKIDTLPADADDPELRITCFEIGQARVQFRTPDDALAWLDESRGLLAAAVVKAAGPVAA